MFKQALKTTGGPLKLAVRNKHTVPQLSYAYDALEPHISKQIMELHHQKHHQTYVTNLNAAEEKLAAAVKDGHVKSAVALESAIRFNGGGHINHSLFWENLAPASENGGKLPEGPLAQAIQKQYGGLEEFKKAFNAALASIQGSGWGWLVQDATSKQLKITTTPNQDPITGDTVILGVDAWEHAYYLQYENAKVKYFDAIWNVINWETAAKRFSS